MLRRSKEGSKVFSARRFAIAAGPAYLPIVAALFVLLSAGTAAKAGFLFGGCDDAAEVAVLPAPLSPWRGAPLRVIVAAEKPLDGELSLIAPDGSVAAIVARAAAGRLISGSPRSPRRPPGRGARSSRAAAVSCPAAARSRARSRCATTPPPPAPATPGSLWPLRNNWNRADGKSLFRVGRKTVRRAARFRAVVAGAL